MPIIVEVCVESPLDALAAAQGGADRVEICQSMSIGGVTPSAGAIAAACARLEIPVHVLIRPRGGDFVYTSLELDEMRHDIAIARGAGAAGVVLGMLDPSGQVDILKIQECVELARPMTVTFHRAFDQAADPFMALESLATIGVDRILTSGRGRTAREGLPILARLVRQAAGWLTFIAGGSVTITDMMPLAAAGVTELHVGSSAQIDSRTDAGRVRALVAAAQALGGEP
jgi:copper homeostasis protein